MSRLVPRRRPAPQSTAVRTSASVRTSVPREVTRARWLLLGLFGLLGITFSSWLSRIPTVRALLDLSTAELGAVLLIGSVAALGTVTVAGAVVQRTGSRAAIAASTGILAVGYMLMGVGPQARSLPLFAVGIALNGIAVALGNVPLNVESGRIERAIGRTVIPQFHAAFSLGAVTGTAIGAVASSRDVPIAVQFSVVAAIAVGWRLASLRGVVIDDASARADVRAPGARVVRAARSLRAGVGRSVPGRRSSVRAAAAAVPLAGRPRRIASALDAWREPRTLLVGVVIMAAALSEGSANDWLSIAVVDGFGRTEAVGGAVLGVFVASMTLVRLLGTRLIDRLGRVVVLRASGLVSLVGLLAFGLAPSLPLAAVGVACWGFGAALAVPIGIAAASDDPVQAPARVAVVSSFSSVASIAAPPLLGLAAEAMGARHALALIAVALVASILLAGRVQAPGARPTAGAGALEPEAPSADHADAADAVRPAGTALPRPASAAGERAEPDLALATR